MSRRWLPGALCLLAMGVALAPGATARGAPDRAGNAVAAPAGSEPAARRAFEDARRAYNLGRWQEAADGFERAYRLVGDPALLYDRAQALRQAGQTAEAISSYKAFLREQPGAPNRPLVEARIRGLEQALKTERPSPGASRPPRTPAAAPSSPSTETDITEPVPVLRQEPAPTPPASGSRWIGWVGAALTAGLVGGAVALGLHVNTRYDELKRTCGLTEGGCSDGEIARLRSRVRWTNVLWAAAGVSALVTGVSFLVTPREAHASVACRF